jgi:hypothetical protein
MVFLEYSRKAVFQTDLVVEVLPKNLKDRKASLGLQPKNLKKTRKINNLTLKRLALGLT